MGRLALRDWGVKRPATSAGDRVSLMPFVLRRAVGLGLACTACVPVLAMAERLLFLWARHNAGYIWFGWALGLFTHLILWTFAVSVAAQVAAWRMGILRCPWAWMVATVASIAFFIAIQYSVLVWL